MISYLKDSGQVERQFERVGPLLIRPSGNFFRLYNNVNLYDCFNVAQFTELTHNFSTIFLY